jgi:hypothetical protein
MKKFSKETNKMKTQHSVLILLVVAAFGLCSCRTTWPGQATVPVVCVVQPEGSVVYEIELDGKLVGSGKVPERSQQVMNFEATRGKHVVRVSAPGMEASQKTIEVTGAGKNLQAFFFELKKSGR